VKWARNGWGWEDQDITLGDPGRGSKAARAARRRHLSHDDGRPPAALPARAGRWRTGPNVRQALAHYARGAFIGTRPRSGGVRTVWLRLRLAPTDSSTDFAGTTRWVAWRRGRRPSTVTSPRASRNQQRYECGRGVATGPVRRRRRRPTTTTSQRAQAVERPPLAGGRSGGRSTSTRPLERAPEARRATPRTPGAGLSIVAPGVSERKGTADEPVTSLSELSPGSEMCYLPGQVGPCGVRQEPAFCRRAAAADRPTAFDQRPPTCEWWRRGGRSRRGIGSARLTR